MKQLPNEIWLLIIESIQKPLEIKFLGREWHDHRDIVWRTPALASLCLTSRELKNLAQPYLYHSLHAWSFNRKRLLQVLAENEHLASMVKQCSLEEVFLEDEVVSQAFEAVQERRVLPRSITHAMAEIIENRADPDHNDDESGAETEEVLIALIMGILPQLESLEFSLGYDFRDSGDKLYHEMMTMGKSRPAHVKPNRRNSPLSKLRELRIMHRDTEYAHYLTAADPCFEHPGLELFCGQAISWGATKPARRPARDLCLTEICLEASLIEADAFREVLSVFPALRRLSITWGSSTVGDCDVDLKDFGDALRAHGHNLEALDLDIKELFSYEYSDEDVMAGMGSLASLAGLKTLSVALDVVVGSEDSDSDDDENGNDDDGNNTGGNREELTLESCLPTGLETLVLYKGRKDGLNRKKENVTAVLQSPRLAQLRQIIFYGGDDIGTSGMDSQGWELNTSHRHGYSMHSLAFTRMPV